MTFKRVNEDEETEVFDVGMLSAAATEKLCKYAILYIYYYLTNIGVGKG